ncbi:hypothetical protein [Kutzneria chonburiensis]|uniref:Uncharacterized protein n=1 Tax=Kutzneria chonburiensis TaxID=1483604 RepID=A0ABV6MSX1_9PSEU|nr:hypothetical protein [Kutzneria chonburiensis]
MPDHAWLYDLIDPDDEVRGRALERQQSFVAEAWRAQAWANDVWARAGWRAPILFPELAPEWNQAVAQVRWNRERSLGGAMSGWLNAGTPDVDRASYALLFLRWEARYPQAWRARESTMFSPWSLKETVLRRFGRAGVPATLRDDAVDLLLAAILRPYRCKDWLYARLIHHVPTDVFRDRVDDPEPLVSARARFLLHVADHPERPVKRASWQRWLDQTGLAVRTDVR